MTTRYGRVIKQPKAVYVPEQVELEDDYSEDEYDSDYSCSDDIPTDQEGGSDDDDEDDDDDDDDGSLKDFVVSDSEETDFSDSEESTT
jgi:hypothetical protein